MKEHEIRPKELYKEYLRLIAQDARKLVGHGRRVPCPGCGNRHTVFLFEKSGFPYERCGRCNTFFCSPRPSMEEMVFFYKSTPSARYWNEVFWPYVEEKRREGVFAPKVSQILAHCEVQSITLKRVLDIGAGNGVFLDEFRKQHPNAEFRAIDPGNNAVAKCREKGFEVLQGTAEVIDQWQGWADLVTSFEVLEHVHDPLKFVSSAMRYVAKNGLVLMSTLNQEGGDLRLLRERSSQVLPPLHINFLSVTGFRTLFARAGFNDIEIETPGRLDMDIIKNALDEGILKRSEIDPFLAWVIYESDEEVKENFQQFLANHEMSSHIWIWAQTGDT